MRISRSIQLSPISGTVHLYWRCHNKEYYLEKPSNKNLYLQSIEKSLNYKDHNTNCKIHSFCIMSNHFHQSLTYYNGSENLSNHMRYAHSVFGSNYNRLHKRSGKVAEGRPKTPLIQNIAHEMNVHFYIEANPIRAGFRNLENLKDYTYCSYGFYAYGIKTQFTSMLTIPKWYIDLGKCDKKRQLEYRRLFRDYILNYKAENSIVFKKVFIGDAPWIKQLKENIKKALLFKLSQLKENRPSEIVNTS